MKIAFILLTAFVLVGCGDRKDSREVATRPCPAQPTGGVKLAGGTFILGGGALLPEEGPPSRVSVAAFEIDRTEVANADFAAFVAATGYVTMAERPPDPALYPGVPLELLKPSSLVFVPAQVDARRSAPDAWWKVIDGADWRHPEGPGSDLYGRERLPVVHVAYDDALAYARWRGRDLPTEAEWEFAAQAGLSGARHEWGDAPATAGTPRANYWQGPFPAVDSGDDGYKAQLAPVGCFPASRYGLFDMSGNVWEWTRDTYGATGKGAPHLIKGGSYLCADDYCYRYRPAARQPGPPDTGGSHIGFRTVRRAAETASSA